MVQRGVHGLRGRDGRGGLLEKKDAAENGTDRHVELTLRSGEEEVSQVSRTLLRGGGSKRTKYGNKYDMTA